MTFDGSPVGVIGVAIRPVIDDPASSLEELLYGIARAAVADAGLGFADVDGIVVAANDQFDGRSIAIMAASGSVGGVNRDILATPSASEHAFIMGALRVRTGQFRTQLVVSWSPTEAASLSEAQRLGADPYFNRALPLDDLSAHALQASVLEAKVEGVRKVARGIAATNRRNGAAAYPQESASPTVADVAARWPIETGFARAPVTGAIAMVLAAPEFIAERGISAPAWIRGMGWATEQSFLGDRDLADAGAVHAAAEHAYRQAEIADPTAAFDLAEVGDATPYQELLALEGLGLSQRDRWLADVDDGRFGRGGALPVNLSGGAQSFNPVFCTGLIRVAEAANQVRGKAGRHQLPGVRRALAHAASGFAMAYSTVVVFEGAGKEMR